MALLSNVSRKIFFTALIQRSSRISYRLVSTTENKADADKSCDSSQPINRKIPDFSKPSENKNWISYGFDFEDKTMDRFQMHFTFFCLITVLFFGGIFVSSYYPDRKRNDWARREAFIRLHEREQLGLEPIDQNYIDPSKVVLPPDEELTDEDMVI